MKGQIGQLKHFFIPLFSLLVLVGALATFDRIILSPIVLGFLNATTGGAGYFLSMFVVSVHLSVFFVCLTNI